MHLSYTNRKELVRALARRLSCLPAGKTSAFHLLLISDMSGMYSGVASSATNWREHAVVESFLAALELELIVKSDWHTPIALGAKTDGY